MAAAENAPAVAAEEWRLGEGKTGFSFMRFIPFPIWALMTGLVRE